MFNRTSSVLVSRDRYPPSFRMIVASPARLIPGALDKPPPFGCRRIIGFGYSLRVVSGDEVRTDISCSMYALPSLGGRRAFRWNNRGLVGGRMQICIATSRCDSWIPLVDITDRSVTAGQSPEEYTSRSLWDLPTLKTLNCGRVRQIPG